MSTIFGGFGTCHGILVATSSDFIKQTANPFGYEIRFCLCLVGQLGASCRLYVRPFDSLIASDDAQEWVERQISFALMGFFFKSIVKDPWGANSLSL